MRLSDAQVDGPGHRCRKVKYFPNSRCIDPVHPLCNPRFAHKPLSLSLDEVTINVRSNTVNSDDSDSALQVATDSTMHPAYFETLFDAHGFSGDWPTRFAIVTAWATTGTLLSQATNDEADRKLEWELQRRRTWRQRITGYSPTTEHAEPGWAVELPFDEACDLTQMFLQDAIYFVDADQLYVTLCDERRQRILVGEFQCRLRSR